MVQRQSCQSYHSHHQEREGVIQVCPCSHEVEMRVVCLISLDVSSPNTQTPEQRDIVM